MHFKAIQRDLCIRHVHTQKALLLKKGAQAASIFQKQ